MDPSLVGECPGGGLATLECREERVSWQATRMVPRSGRSGRSVFGWMQRVLEFGLRIVAVYGDVIVRRLGRASRTWLNNDAPFAGLWRRAARRQERREKITLTHSLMEVELRRPGQARSTRKYKIMGDVQSTYDLPAQDFHTEMFSRYLAR